MASMKNIAVISTRSGSKGLPDKNLKILNGKPLIAYSIEVAISAGCKEKYHLCCKESYRKLEKIRGK